MVQALTDARIKGAQQRIDAAKARAKAWANFESAVYAAEMMEDPAAPIATSS